MPEMPSSPVLTYYPGISGDFFLSINIFAFLWNLGVVVKCRNHMQRVNFMPVSYVVYIDESGDEGFEFSEGSSEWFVLSAVIIKKEIDLQTVKLIDAAKTRLGMPADKILHFRNLDHNKRLTLIDEISRADLRISSIIMHKPSFKEPVIFQGRYRFYFYSTRYLLERVSWFCRDARTPDEMGDSSAEFIFSNRSGMSYEDMRNYLGRLKDNNDVNIDWSVVNIPNIKPLPAASRMGLQIADAAASGIYCGV